MEPKTYVVFLLMIAFPIAHGSVPGTFFWNPRLGIDMDITTARPIFYEKTKANMKAGLVLLIDGYQIGMSIVALANGISSSMVHLHMNPLSSYFYTNSYRWALRHLSLFPPLLTYASDNYIDTHKVWRKRFSYTEAMVPEWIKYMLPVPGWKKEKYFLKKYKRYAAPTFERHFKYPSKIFNNFKSQENKRTIETSDTASSDPVWP